MCCCAKKILSTFGWVFTLIFGLLGIGAIVVSAIPFKLIQIDWLDGSPYASFGVVTLTCVIVVVVVMIFGFIEFICCSEKKCFGIFYLIIQMICVIFALAIALFGLVAGTVGKVSDELGCVTTFEGILSFWANLDELFIYVDIGLCSPDCHCYMSDKVQTSFKDNTTVSPYYNAWIVSRNQDDAVSFQNCFYLHQYVENKFQEYDLQNGNHIGKFNIAKFAKYWNFIEEKFNCTALCNATFNYNDAYVDDVLNVNGAFYKYLFSDVNRGIVEHLGCLKSIVDWLPPFLLSYGLLAFACSILTAFTWIFALILVCGCDKK